MKASTRIILNTGASYARSVFAIVMSLFSTRWILEALGQSDFGLFGVVGSLIVMITFLNGGLQVGVTRFYAYAIGEGENESKAAATDRLKRWFNTAFSIHLVLPLILILIGWPVGEYAIEHWLTIPDGRLNASLSVFRVSLLTAFMTVFGVPFVAMYSAHQRIVELSIFGMLRTSAVFVVAWSLLHVSSDRLVVYAYAMAGISVVISIIQIGRAIVCFPACRLNWNYIYSKPQMTELFGFVGWKMFGMSCVTMRAQGTPMLINLYFGPLVNAAYSVANGLSTQATALSQSLTSAFRPAVITAEGKGDREGMLSMALQACKFGSLLILIFAVPLILEMRNLLDLWLKTPPAHAVSICQWLLGMLIVDRMTTGHMLAVNARGKIAFYELIQGLLLLSALPVMWLFFKAGQGPWSVGGALFASMLVYCIGRIAFAKFLLSFPILPWLRRVALPVLTIVLLVFMVGILSTESLPMGFIRLGVTSVLCALTSSALAWLVLFNQSERMFVLSGFRKVLSKLTFSQKSSVSL